MPRLSRPVWGFLLFLLGGALFKARLEGDTIALLNGASNLVACAKESRWPCTTACHFPFFQTGVALLTSLVAGTQNLLELTPRVYALFSALSFIGMIVAGRRGLFRSGHGRAAELFTLAVIQSPFLWYARSTFLELTGGFLLLWVTLQLADKRSPKPALLVGTAFVACLTKEIYPPLIGLWSLFLVPLRSSRSWREKLLPLAVGLLAGLSANVAWNWLRYGVPYNLELLNPKFIVPDLTQHLRFVLALIVSPNGGLILYWPLGMILLALGITLSWRARDHRVQALGQATLLSAVLVGIARWFAPMGWVSWGPRLVLPWIPAILWASLRYAPDEGLKFFERKGGQWVLGACALLSVPQALIMFDRDSFNGFFGGWPVAACRAGVNIDTDPAGHYACLNHLMGFAPENWIWGSVWKATLTNPGFAGLALLYLAILAHSIFRIAQNGRDPACAADPAQGRLGQP